MAISTCGLPATGGPCKRTPGHRGNCHSGAAPLYIIPEKPIPVDKPRTVKSVGDILNEIVSEYFGTRGFRRMRRDLIVLIASIIVFAWVQFAFDLYILIR